MIHSLAGSTDQSASTLIKSQNRFLRKTLSLLPDHAVVKKVLVSERLKASNTKGTAESVDKEGISSSGLWPVKQTKPFICKDEEACNLWSHTQVYHPGAVIYDQHRLFVTTPQGTGFVAWIVFVPPACCVHVVRLQDKHWELQLIQDRPVITPSGNSGFMP